MAFRVSLGKKLALFIIGGLLLVALSAQTFGFFRNFQAPQLIQTGYLDLSDWDFERDGNLKLDGEWEFYWDSLVTYEDILSGVNHDLYGKVPSAWTSYSLGGRRLPGQGYGTYCLRIKTDLKPGEKLGMLFPPISSAYRVFINWEEVAARGAVSADPARSSPVYRPQAVQFTLPDSEFHLIVQVSNFNHARGGFWESAILGSSAGIASLQNKQENWQILFSGALAILAMLYFCLFVLRRQEKEYLYLALLAVVLIVLIDAMNQFWIYRVFPQISFHWIFFMQYACISWTVTLLTLLTEDLFPTRFSKSIVKGCAGYTVVLTLLYMFTPVRFYTGIHVFLNIMGLSQLLFVVYLTIYAMLRNEEGSGPYMVGFGASIFTSIHDTLFVNNIISSSGGKVMYIGVAILFFTGSIVHAIRYTRSFNKISLLLHKLRLLNEQRDEFMFNTAHEIRAPLAAVTALSDELLAGQDNSDLRKMDNLARIRAFSTKASNLVNEILDYSFLQRGGLSLNLEAVNLNTVTDNVLQVFRQIMRSEVLLESEIPEGLPMVYADEDRLYQILYNLMGYAFKQASRSTIRVAARRAGISIETAVTNTGAALVWDQSTDKLLSAAESGIEGARIGDTELSMFISRQLIALQGGTIRVKSDSRGIEICFTLPAARAVLLEDKGQTLPERVRDTAGSISLPGTGPHILVVDDNVNTLTATANILGHSGFKVTAVPDGILAAEYVRMDPSVSVVLLDLMIPGTGYGICRQIRSLKGSFDLPVLILAAKTAVRDIEVGLNAGANDYLAKPYEKEELLARVRTLAHLKESVDKTIASEISFLQAQIKPHFLHNALSVIASLTVSNPPQARSLLIHLSEYLRNSFDFAQFNDMVSLAQEIELVNAYVAIEKARFGARLDFQLNANGVHATIPRLVLQPLVENAICHGIFHNPKGGQVQLLVEQRLDHVYFCVKDNGVGMDQNHVDSLLSEEVGRTGVGITNINKRLCRYYGSGLTIHSVPGQGTAVSFAVPQQAENIAKEA